ncbi:hypothetical protein WBP07_31110 [Novosphingobium sp. BL-8A]|uniref:hypothetical protein n=1 Tax=Novosphingobium sp. BL-8A TaxID=3127639 RepID=UPI00375841C0
MEFCPVHRSLGIPLGLIALRSSRHESVDFSPASADWYVVEIREAKHATGISGREKQGEPRERQRKSAHIHRKNPKMTMVAIEADAVAIPILASPSNEPKPAARRAIIPKKESLAISPRFPDPRPAHPPVCAHR